MLGLVFALSAMLAKVIPGERQFMEQFSILNPHVAENGKNPYYVLSGGYVVYNMPQSNYTKLGYPVENSRGIVSMREPLKTRTFCLEVSLALNTSKKGASCGLWLVEAAEKGDYYGISPEYNGVGIIIDAKGRRPFVQCVDSKGKINAAAVFPATMDGRCKVTIEHFNKQLNVTFAVGNYKYTVYNGASRITPSSRFALSADTGASAMPIILYGVEGYAVSALKERYVKGESSKNSTLVTILGLICIVALIYYLFQKQSKPSSFKN